MGNNIVVAQGIWEEFLKIIKEEAGSPVVETWFKAVVLYCWDSRQRIVYLQTPNSFVRDWLQTNYLQLIQITMCRLLNIDGVKVVFINSTLSSGVIKENEVPVDISSLRVEQKKELIETVAKQQVGHLNGQYQLETFVVGPSNSLAYAAACAVTEKPGCMYNPLCMYGESGLGKTHLLQAIGNKLKETQLKAAVLYQSADRFVNEFVSAIRFDRVHKFQEKYRHVDVLLIDDIQFISKKDQTQEAFFHIFNALYDAKKQIVFSSDTYPQDMVGIADRLRSRLSCGLVVDLHTPSLETKVAILNKKAEMSGHCLPDDVIFFIASQSFSNIRELEGSLIRIIAFSSLTKQPITIELAKKVLVRMVQVTKQDGVDLERIVSYTAKYFDFTINELKSKNRSKEVSLVRQVAMFLMKKMTNKSLRDIGSFLGGRDHSTVVHAVERVQEEANIKLDFAQKLAYLEQEIRN